ncbi:hypothetical protein H0H87_000326 [Tephrocybe sp. NHM501043]|nr:hypothetical protein H0H87_000326 [Tephrocybe sp. NHM501043]
MQNENERGTAPSHAIQRERERDITTTALTRFSSRTSTAGTPSPYATRRHLPPTAGEHEHTRLLETSLASLDAAAARARGETRGVDEVVRGAQGVVGAAARLNEMLRGGAARALEEQVRAEVDDAGGGAEGEVWGRVGAEYREGVRASDELVRGLTVLLLGVGKVVRELGAPLDAVVGGGVHARSVSLDEEGLRRRRGGSMSPDVGGVPRTVSGPGSSAGGSASASGSERRSVESRRSWEPSGGGGGRLASLRAESARPASAFGSAALRERERETGRALAGTPRRLFMPREEREMQQVPLGVGEDRPDADAPTVRSQERGYGEYEPSPTPVSRAAREWERDRERERETDRTRAFAPPPKPLPSLPSESLRRNHAVSGSASNTIRDSERRVASISTVRANASTSNNTSNSNSTGTTGTGPSSSSFHPPASLPAPSGTTTALTPHTVSTHTPDRTAFPSLPRTDSDRSVRSSTAPSGAAAAGVAFSRSSVSALVGVRRLDTQRRERERVESGAGGDNNNNKNGTDATDAPAPPQPQPQLQPQLPRARALQLRESRSGSETERPPPRRLLQTLGVRAGGRVSLDGSGGGGGVLPAPQGDLARRGTLGNANGNANGNGHPTDRSAGMGPPMNTAARRERRRTVTDIWPRE